ncbi:hypothetical protein A3K34_01860 [candidate division WWE3 bacterium RIFOXYC1_FULL_40_10]|uniref:Glycosyltransferase RgtA/B/C/D-like domain-containing protein n=1 Tax=candidate division WWE3 bacterium RIFOXYA2_FULL_46_9 TaxID=1802636 RepID=A0A1F4W2S0_UNCKA|nr:MAG: hypothetical protein A3K58_01860 [candidate division WWE3 bacterium RIFOXYB1_FULL_40_22]OGC61608.1 MAG: hypothetical protein A3K37_01860 [candidate division WWE3 bacterium RIFOXYA1_FULL_40_11]OGC63655.1 MAG: hypothetical protein A2264_04805 [candidate division WWE3 bacterium RIFOXYA2_FULL_46_9]OGC64713.1 MAG: hypothetical protein A2326_01585 [candidate division WWE3 bacterium RIFOXYB2_FULL_41_6]OGC65991.1 MAG: hypothetical protein A3K34_01860 [candidate division WWE3 bacterium RIFOXYC1_
MKLRLLISALLFGVCFPLVSSVDFKQNDDWIYYRNAVSFLSGDFTLDPYMGPTFYTQGILGAGYIYFFGGDTLPVLSLLFSVGSFYLFTTILSRFLKLTSIDSVMLGMLLFVNPLNVHSFLGFMTEAYFLFLMLLCLYLFLFYLDNPDLRQYVLLVCAIVIAFFSRQVVLFMPLGFAVFGVLTKKPKTALLSFATFLGLAVYYKFLFPASPAMQTKAFSPHHLLEFDYSFAIFYGILILLTAFVTPLVVNAIIPDNRPNIAKALVLLIFAVLLYFGSAKLFKPDTVSWGEFPYFENTLERSGFYPRGVFGTKYLFKWNYDLYRYWDLGSKLLVGLLVSSLFVFRRKILNLYSVLIVTYMLVMIVTQRFFDRYLLELIPLFIMFLLKIKERLRFSYPYRSVIAGFTLFLAFYSYQFGMDFVGVNKYIWNKSEEIVEREKIEPSKIQGTNAWKLSYRNYVGDYKYTFSYDSPDVNQGFKDNWTLVEEHQINYPLNIFIEPKIYLYRR